MTKENYSFFEIMKVLYRQLNSAKEIVTLIEISPTFKLKASKEK